MWRQCRDSNIGDYELKLREMEMETYSKIISVFRAKGNLSNDRRKLLKQISSFLNIPPERHRAEARKVSNDDLLAEMAVRLTGKDWTIDWCQEGKRNIPTPLRFPNETVCTPLADYIASLAAIGPRCIESINSNTEPSSSSLKQDPAVPIDSDIKNNWTQLLDSVSETKKRTNSVKSVSVQTVRRKVSPQGCTYCKRRKEMKKKKSLKETNVTEKVSDEEVIEDGSKNTITVSNKKVEVTEPSNNSLIILPSGKKILIENSCEDPYEDITDSISATIIAQEIEVETEPFEVIECKDFSETEEVPKFDTSIPSTSKHLGYENTCTDSSSMTDGANDQNISLFMPAESDSIQHRIPRILSCGQRKRGGLKRPQNSMDISSSLGMLQVEKKQKIEIEEEEEEDSENFISVSEANPSTSQTEVRIITSSDSDESDDLSSSCSADDDEEEEEEIIQSQDECSVISNVYSKVANSPSDIIYQIQNESNSPLEESASLSIEMADVNPSPQIISCTLSSKDDLSPSTFASSTEEVKTCLSKSSDDPLPLKIIKIYNGEKKVHGTIHLRSGNMKDFLSRLPNARVTQVLMKKSNNEENQITSITNSFQETHVLLKENMTDNSNQIQKSSIPLVNGHEESYLAAEISVQADPYSCPLENETVEECSSKCLSHQGNSDRKEAALFNLQSVLSSSKEDSKETDQFINGT